MRAKAIRGLSLLCVALGLQWFTGLARPDDGVAPRPDDQIAAYLRNLAIEMDGRFLDGIRTKEDWERVRPVLKQQYLEMLGLWPLPERTPLNATITGTLEFDDFVVEKLHFQSRPRLYVTANLYRPCEPKGKLPAVLYLCGHANRGRDGNKTAYQHHGIWFAKNGYVCLMLDTLQLGEIAGIHHGTYRYNRWWWQSVGYTPAGVECWNAIRAIDFLQSRPDVDPERIAVTGRSGGGAATFWVAAADERVRVAVPVSGMSDLEDYVANRVINGHCDCMFLVNTYRWPWTYIAALVVPRPMLFLNSGRDRIFPMGGNERVRRRLERLYRLYTDRPDELFDVGTVPGPHRDQLELRLMAYRWINRHLKGDNSPVEEGDLPEIPGEQLRVFPDELPADEINTKIDEHFVTASPPPLPSTAAEYPLWRAVCESRLFRLTFRDVFPLDDRPHRLPLGTEPLTARVQTEPPVTVELHYWPPRGTDRGWIVIADEALANAPQDHPEWLRRIRADGEALLIVIPRGVGPLAWKDPPPYYVRRSMALLGRTVEGTRLMDALAVTDRALKNSGPVTRWSLAGSGEAAVLAAYVALLRPGVAGVYMHEPSATHREGPILLNVLRTVDVPQAVGLLAPRPVRISTSRPELFRDTVRLYELAGARDHLSVEQLPVGN